jgi:hypothetical protein
MPFVNALVVSLHNMRSEDCLLFSEPLLSCCGLCTFFYPALQVAASLARSVAKPGGAVLIFVSGMADITELMEVLTTQLQSQQGQGQGGVKRGGGSAVAAGECLLIGGPHLSAGTAMRAYVAHHREGVHC